MERRLAQVQILLLKKIQLPICRGRIFSTDLGLKNTGCRPCRHKVGQLLCYVLPGFNSDITVSGQPFHVQTEDWGFEQRLVVTKIFSRGAVIKSFKTSYSDLLVGAAVTEAALLKGIQDQHQRIIQYLMLDGGKPLV